MKKSSAIVWLVALIALLAGGIYACVFGFDAAGTGSAKEIKQGLDLAGGQHYLSGCRRGRAGQG